VGAVCRLARLKSVTLLWHVERMFDLEVLAAVDPHADDAALIEQIAASHLAASAPTAQRQPTAAR
jgi:hypothetical protein